MLVPAYEVKEQLLSLFHDRMYDGLCENLLYIGIPEDDVELNITDNLGNTREFAIIDCEMIVGFFAYEIQVTGDTINLTDFYVFYPSLIDKITINDIMKKIDNLIDVHHRIRWKMPSSSSHRFKIESDNICRKYREDEDYDVHRACFYDIKKCADGNYVDEFMYDISHNHIIGT